MFQVELFDKLGEWVAADGRWGLLNRKKRSPQAMDQIQQAAAVDCTYSFEKVCYIPIAMIEFFYF